MTRRKSNKIILLTCGDPNGIGPEIILKIFASCIFKNEDLKVVGHKGIFDFYAKRLKLPLIKSGMFVTSEPPSNFKVKPGNSSIPAGSVSALAVYKATNECLKGNASAMVTLPICKESVNSAGYNFAGHTEMLAVICKSKKVAMILYSKNLSISPLTGHVPLKRVASILKPGYIKSKIKLVNQSLINDFKISNPSIALLSLNPHAGDGGVTGNQEVKILSPVISEMKKNGLNISGPFPADGFFAFKEYKKFDIVVSCYHDQGLIPFKMIDINGGVNYTAGLPIVRTSPVHGTAFDIAGKGIANPQSTVNAIKMAIKISRVRK